MGKVLEDVAALRECQELLAACQRENELLIEGYRFYADSSTYRVPVGRVWRPIDNDDGARAREILKEVVGYE